MMIATCLSRLQSWIYHRSSALLMLVGSVVTYYKIVVKKFVWLAQIILVKMTFSLLDSATIEYFSRFLSISRAYGEFYYLI